MIVDDTAKTRERMASSRNIAQKVNADLSENILANAMSKYSAVLSGLRQGDEIIVPASLVALRTLGDRLNSDEQETLFGIYEEMAVVVSREVVEEVTLLYMQSEDNATYRILAAQTIASYRTDLAEQNLRNLYSVENDDGVKACIESAFATNFPQYYTENGNS